VIYTVGKKSAYESALDEVPDLKKKGRCGWYSGGSVWETKEEAAKHCPDGYKIYGVLARWNIDTEPSQNGPWHGLLIDAQITRI